MLKEGGLDSSCGSQRKSASLAPEEKRKAQVGVDGKLFCSLRASLPTRPVKVLLTLWEPEWGASQNTRKGTEHS